MESSGKFKPIYYKKGFYILAAFLVVIFLLSFSIGRNYYLGRAPNLLHFALIHFSGYLFFLVMPVELIYIYYIAEAGNPFITLIIAIATAMFAQLIDYGSGYLFSSQIIQLFGGGKYYKAKQKINAYGNLVVFVFNLLPLSSPILLVAAGMIKYPFRRAFFFSFLGLLLKYLFLMFFFL
jgi:membrane protein DedA with SNARE-associated domain